MCRRPREAATCICRPPAATAHALPRQSSASCMPRGPRQSAAGGCSSPVSSTHLVRAHVTAEHVLRLLRLEHERLHLCLKPQDCRERGPGPHSLHQAAGGPAGGHGPPTTRSRRHAGRRHAHLMPGCGGAPARLAARGPHGRAAPPLLLPGRPLRGRAARGARACGAGRGGRAIWVRRGHRAQTLAPSDTWRPRSAGALTPPAAARHRRPARRH